MRPRRRHIGCGVSDRGPISRGSCLLDQISRPFFPVREATNIYGNRIEPALTGSDCRLAAHPAPAEFPTITARTRNVCVTLPPAPAKL